MSRSVTDWMRADTWAARQSQIGGPHHLALAHRDAARNLRDIFSEPDANEQLLGLAKRSLAGHARGIGGKLTHRLRIGREPGEPMGGALLAVEQAADDMAFHRHPLAHFGRRVGQQGIEGRARLVGELDQIGICAGGTGSGDWHQYLGAEIGRR